MKIRVVTNKKPIWGGIQCTHAHTRAVMTARGEWPMQGHGGSSWKAQPAMLHIVDSWTRRRDGTDGARRRSIAKQGTQATQTDGHCGAISTQQGRPQAAFSISERRGRRHDEFEDLFESTHPVMARSMSTRVRADSRGRTGKILAKFSPNFSQRAQMQREQPRPATEDGT